MAYEELRNVAEWLAGGDRAIMLVTSSLYHPEVNGDYVDETAGLVDEMSRWDMAMTMTWLARLASEAMVSKHNGNREAALEEVRFVALQLQEARLAAALPEEAGR